MQYLLHEYGTVFTPRITVGSVFTPRMRCSIYSKTKVQYLPTYFGEKSVRKLVELGQPYRSIIIGIKHGFSCINIRQIPWEVLKTEAEGRGFQYLPKDLANVNTLKNHV